MVYNILPNQATAAGESAAAGEAGMVADPSTVNSYTEMVGTENDGNRYAGRIWTDKSVYSDTALFEEDLNEELTAAQIKDLTDAVSDDEFLAVFYDSVNKVYINSDGTTSDTAGLRVAPTLNSNSEHEGSMVAWLGNNGRIDNTAYIQIGNNSAYETNTTVNPPVDTGDSAPVNLYVGMLVLSMVLMVVLMISKKKLY